MDVDIARLNIAHFKKLIANETDESRRRTLGELLSQEEKKLELAIKARKAKTA